MAITSWLMDGTMDNVARELGLDPVAVRRLNMLEPRDYPYTMATGEVLADITPRETMEGVLAAIGYEAFRARQAQARSRGEILGLGICTVVESTTYGSKFYKAAGIPGSGHEAAWVRIEPSGVVSASVGLGATGQGYETALSQAVAEGLGIPSSQVKIHLGHTDIAPYGMGSGGTLYLCAQDARRAVLAIAAHRLQVPLDAVRMQDGQVQRHEGGAWQDAGLALADIARVAYLDPLALPPGMSPGLEFHKTYEPPPMTYSNSSHACIVRLDAATGALQIERYVAAEDCGTVLSPVVVEGQQHGAIAMGLSGSLMEHVEYDEDTGQNLSGSLADYLVATANEIPRFELIAMHTPNRATPAGIKGMAEGGVMGSIGALMNAVNDALAPFGVRADRQPLSPTYLRSLLRGKQVMEKKE
jgi:carbon-monoxide dehydrogenase large subunit